MRENFGKGALTLIAPMRRSIPGPCNPIGQTQGSEMRFGAMLLEIPGPGPMRTTAGRRPTPAVAWFGLPDLGEGSRS